MARPLRIEFPGAVYHVTSRGDRREPIFVDDEDRRSMLAVVEQAMARFDAQVLAYCLMGNHYHLVLNTRQANLSRLMRHLNGVTTQNFNRRHGKVGHLFQGRFKAILVDRESYLLEVCRYVELNPVRAGIVDEPGAWPWSSFRAHVGQADPAPWLDTSGVHGFLLGRDVHTAAERRQAGASYAEWVSAGRDVPLWDRALRQQIYLGDERFVERMQALAVPPGPASARSAREVPMAQRRRLMTLPQWLAEGPTREQALWHAHVQGGLTMTAMAHELGLSVSRVSRLIAKAEAAAPSEGRGSGCEVTMTRAPSPATARLHRKACPRVPRYRVLARRPR
jgi:REP element-mobilizing transposase RayT/AraC-like DNA-binding protein